MAKEITKTMIEMYGLKDLDFMGYELIVKEATFHHLKKKEHGGKVTIDNGAVLMPVPHSYLHTIENVDYRVYELLTELMFVMNRRGYIIEEDYKIIGYILTLFEEKYEDKTTKKGKPIVKDVYKRRRYK